MKLNVGNITVVWVTLAISGGCSSEGATAPNGTETDDATRGGANVASAGTFVAESGGVGGKRFVSAGTSSNWAGTFSSAGTSTGSDGGAGGSGGAGAAGTATHAGGGDSGAGGTDDGGPTLDFPASCPAPSGTHGATPLTRDCWSVRAQPCTGDPPLQAVDEAGTATRYSSGTRMTTSQAFSFELDLGSVVTVDGVRVTSRSGSLDYAPLLQVALSTDGTTFSPSACGPGSVSTDFSFPPTPARYVRLVQHGTAEAWWSIHDLNVYAASGATCEGGGMQTSTCAD